MALNKFPQRQPGHYLCILLWRVIVLENKMRLKHALWKKQPLDKNLFSCLLFLISYFSPNSLKHGKYKHMYHIFLILWNSEFCTFPAVIFSRISRKKALDFGLIIYENDQKMQLCWIIYYSLAAKHVSNDIFVHHQEHLNCITAFGITNVCRCRPAKT
jgi:hypothetical protein